MNDHNVNSLENKGSSFSKREWFFVILIITLIQGFTWYAAFINAGNGSALNFISFAGTLISIILAVLAIGYTYGESLHQKNQSDTVVSQISSLNKTIEKLKNQSDEFENIRKISEDLNGFKKYIVKGFDNNKESFKSLSEEVRKINNKDLIKSEVEEFKFITESERIEFVDSLINSRDSLSESIMLSLILFDGEIENGYLPDSVDESLILALNECDDIKKDEKYNVVGYLNGAIFTTKGFLEGFGLITHDKDDDIVVVKINKQLRDKYYNSVKNDSIQLTPFTRTFKKELLKRIERTN